MMNLLGNRDKLQQEMAKMQETVARIVTDGTAGGGLVTVKVNGRMEVLSVSISEEAWKLQDREMLEDLMAAATNSALNKAREALAAETAKMAGAMGIPPGMLGGLGGGLPGLG
jgi:nucleoid-associated protein EbfC